MLKREGTKYSYAPRKHGSDTVIEGLKGITIGDFWSWAYSDVINNTTRSVFAEYLVGLALDATSKPRIEWGYADLLHEGKRIEVKSSAFLQSWPQASYSDVRFDVRVRKYAWDPETGETRGNDSRPADCYVFCLYTDKDEETANVLEVGRWIFYVVQTAAINRELGGRKSIGLDGLKRLASPVGFGQLRESIEKAVFEKNRK
jgi:hypothetical protein